jgi:hypothetical protein
MKMEQTEYSETSAYKIQTPGNYREENIQQIYSHCKEILFHVLKNDRPIQKYEYRNICVLGEIKTLYIP